MKKVAAVVLFGLLGLVVLAPPFILGHWMYGLLYVAFAGILAVAMLASLRSRATAGMVFFALLTMVALALPFCATNGSLREWLAWRDPVIIEVLAAICATMTFAGLHLWRGVR